MRQELPSVGGREEQEGFLTQEDSLARPTGEPRIPRKVSLGGRREVDVSSMKIAWTLAGIVPLIYWESFTSDRDFLGTIPHSLARGFQI